jgi:apolipoprotein N-acyltransferase
MAEGRALPLGLLRSNRLRYPSALVAGAGIWCLSLPPYGLGILAVLAFVPPLLAVPDESPRRAAAWGWAGGILWEFATLWWLIPTMVRYGAIHPIVAFLLVAGMCAVLGLYMAGFMATAAALTRRRGPWGLTLAPLAWVLWEWLRGRLFSGMPWWGPGYALSTYPSFLQEVRLFGILGLSLVSLLCACAVALWIRYRTHEATRWTVPAAALLLASAYVWGTWMSGSPIGARPAVAVGYLDPNIAQDRKWDQTFSSETLATLLRLTEAMKHYELKLMVWPESATPFEWDQDASYRQAVGEAAKTIGAPILLGSVLSGPKGYQNGAVLVGPDGTEEARYAKTHLVPFGEYVPFRSLLFFARPIVDTIGDFAPGASLAPLDSPAGRLGVTICFEGIFPELVRRQVRGGAQVLVNITNDAWYEGTPGPTQHFLLERVRAVETDRYLVRSANRGISGVVTPRGTLEAATTPGQAASFWGLVEARDTSTLWTRVGDWWLLLALLAVAAALLFRRGRAS